MVRAGHSEEIAFELTPLGENKPTMWRSGRRIYPKEGTRATIPEI